MKHQTEGLVGEVVLW